MSAKLVCNVIYSLKLHQGKFRLGMVMTFFMDRDLKHWNGLPRKMMGSPSLEVFKK